MVRLSVNVNKVATLRNSRGGQAPSVLEAVRVILAAGAPGITVHPRADARHITRGDVLDIAQELSQYRRDSAEQHRRTSSTPAPEHPGISTRAPEHPSTSTRAPVHPGTRAPFVEFNIEGDPRPDLMALVHEVRPDQCTLVPVLPSEVTSQGRWPEAQAGEPLRRTIAALRRDGIRVSVFIDPDAELVRWAADRGADRVELFTEPFARAWVAGPGEAAAALKACALAAEAAHALGLGVNAGHDLDHENLVLFRELPHLAEVSIGHALISRALFNGLDATVRQYLSVLAGE
jgi:pyridoxine 5-phosphate synthase